MILIGRFGSQSLVGCFEFIHWYAVVIEDIYLGVSAIEWSKEARGEIDLGPRAKGNPQMRSLQQVRAMSTASPAASSPKKT